MKSNYILVGKLGYLQLKSYSRNKDSKQLLVISELNLFSLFEGMPLGGK